MVGVDLAENKIVVICEDDIMFLNESDIEYTNDCIETFCKNYAFSDNILYLQSLCPWRNILKTYNLNDCLNENGFYLLNNNFHDLSGTVCYAVNPISAQKLINYIKTQGISPLDQMLMSISKNKILNYLIPQRYQNNAHVNMNLQ